MSAEEQADESKREQEEHWHVSILCTHPLPVNALPADGILAVSVSENCGCV